jgi:hypothetical protein
MIAHMMGMRRCSASIAWFRSYRQELFIRLRAVGMAHSIVREVEPHTNCSSHLHIHGSIVPRHVVTTSRNLWIALPFHPVWVGDINRCLDQFSRDDLWSRIIRDFIGSDVVGFKAALKLNMPSLVNIVKRF